MTESPFQRRHQLCMIGSLLSQLHAELPVRAKGTKLEAAMLANAEGLCQAITATLPASWNLVELSYAATNFGSYAAAASPSIATFFTKAPASSRQAAAHHLAALPAHLDDMGPQPGMGESPQLEAQMAAAGQHHPQTSHGGQMPPGSIGSPLPQDQPDLQRSLLRDAPSQAASSTDVPQRAVVDPLAAAGASSDLVSAARIQHGTAGPVAVSSTLPNTSSGKCQGSVASSSSQPGSNDHRPQQQLAGRKRKLTEGTSSSLSGPAEMTSGELQTPLDSSIRGLLNILPEPCSHDQAKLQSANVPAVSGIGMQPCTTADGDDGPLAASAPEACIQQECGGLPAEQSTDPLSVEARLCARSNRAAMEEQRRIMRDIELRRLAGLPGKHKVTLPQKFSSKPNPGSRNSSQQTLLSSKHFSLKPSS